MKNSNIIFMLLMTATLLLSACSEINNHKNNVGIANPASTFCVENGGRLEIRTNADKSESGICIFENGRECDEWAFFRGECNKDSYSDSELELFCKNEQGKWIESTKECEYIDSSSCYEKGGKFYECESACRNNQNAEVCTMQCVPVCKFEDKEKEKFCGGIAGIPCKEGFECKLDGSYPDAGGICIEKEPLKCTKEYIPVCGADGITYGNKCMAGNMNIISDGSCSDSNDKETDSEKIFCTEEQKSAEICTMEYMPVCGNDKVTYGNKCSACGSKKIDYYTIGECTIVEESNNYKLIEMNSKKIENLNAEIALNKNTKDMSGNAGCNRMFSKFELNDDTITFGPISSTMMYCEDSMNIETELLNILNNGKLRLEYNNDILNMYSNSSLVLVWKEN